MRGEDSLGLDSENLIRLRKLIPIDREEIRKFARLIWEVEGCSGEFGEAQLLKAEVKLLAMYADALGLPSAETSDAGPG